MNTKLILLVIGSATLGAITSASMIYSKIDTIIEQSINSLTMNQKTNELPSETPANQLVENPAIAVLRSEISHLMQQISSLEKRLDEQENISNLTTTLEPTKQTNNTGPDETLSTYTDDSTVTDQLDYYDSYMSTEIQDVNWSLETEQSIYSTFDQPELSGSQAIYVECKLTLCRAEIDHDSTDDFEKFKFLFASQLSSELPNGSMRHSEGNDGHHKTTVYLTRKGHDFPTMNHE